MNLSSLSRTTGDTHIGRYKTKTKKTDAQECIPQRNEYEYKREKNANFLK